MPPRPIRAVLFDFDGTLSLLRGGWATIMQAQFLVELRRAGDTAPEHQLAERIRAGILSNNGRPTIWQMRFLADEIRRVGGQPGEPEEYLAAFLERLLAVVGERRSRLHSGDANPNDFTVPGTPTILSLLRRRGIPLILASGTDWKYVENEAALLGVAAFFEGRLFAPRDEDPTFTKRAVIENFLRATGLSGEGLVGFGDGAVETAEVKRVGGRAVAVACDEEAPGRLDNDKRAVLIRAGADLVIPDYRAAESVLAWLEGTPTAGSD